MNSSKTSSSILLIILISLAVSSAARNLLSLYKPPPIDLAYHGGALLGGDLRLTLLWYGRFTAAQKAVVVDFFSSLDGNATAAARGNGTPAVSRWWQTVQTYLQKAGKERTRFVSLSQLSDEHCSMGKVLTKSRVSELAQLANSESTGAKTRARRGDRAAPKSKPWGLTIVLTAADVAVEGFCMSNCGTHGGEAGAREAFVWVGNSVTQCPGQCAWPFHRPIYGPQAPPLVAPNGDVGVDGMIVNAAALVAGAVTNPFGDGYCLGTGAEAASACTGVYGKGAYPGYAGALSVDSATGGSYNARGVKGRKYLLPALVDVNSLKCSTLV